MLALQRIVRNTAIRFNQEYFKQKEGYMAGQYDTSRTPPSVQEQQNQTQTGVSPSTRKEDAQVPASDTRNSNVRQYEKKETSSMNRLIPITGVIMVIIALVVLFFLLM